MHNGFREFLKYCLSEKVPLFKVGNAIYTCENNTDHVEDMCGWKFVFSERFQVFMFFAIGLCIYAIISSLFIPIADALAAEMCKTAEIPDIFFPAVKLITAFYVDRKVCECLDDLA